MQWKTTAAAALLAVGSSTAIAAELKLDVEIPALQVAEYHRPYVAIWIETDKGRHQTDLAVWYDLELKDNEGTKWLKDLRQWWRRSGRQLEFPVDGLSGATRPVGTHSLTFGDEHAGLVAMKPGDYQLVVEAAREVGGRELLKLPFTWPVAAASEQTQNGEHELGRVTLSLQP